MTEEQARSQAEALALATGITFYIVRSREPGRRPLMPILELAQTVSLIWVLGRDPAKTRNPGLEFATDSPLEEAVMSELVSEARIPC